MATKQARGTKRTCQSCEERFYDLERAPILCPHCNAKYVIASSPAALAAFQAEEKAARAKPKKIVVQEEAEGELPAVEGEEALVDAEGGDETPSDSASRSRPEGAVTSMLHFARDALNHATRTFRGTPSPRLLGRGYSSAGRALAWHARGHRFDPG
jgi:uncharacterized protein (TIGR02300 family)